MLKKSLSFFLLGVLLYVGSAVPVAALTKAEKEAQHATKVKTEIAKLGTGQAARISLKLRDKTKLSGYVAAAGAESFVVADLSTGATTTVPYPNVVQVRGNNLSTGVKIAIWAGVIVAVVIVLYAVRGAFCDGC